MSLKVLFFISLMLLLAHCGPRNLESPYQAGEQTKPNEKPSDDSSELEPPVDKPDDKAPQHKWHLAWNTRRAPQHKEWTTHIWSELHKLNPQVFLQTPADIAQYCKKWNSLDLENRKAFVVALLSKMIKLESYFNSNLTYTEKFKDRSGKQVVSRGLLQLSVESSRYYGCSVTEKTLHDPKINLSCGIKILTKWMAEDQHIGSSLRNQNSGYRHFGGARYWSVLRSTSQKRQKIISFMNQQPACR